MKLILSDTALDGATWRHANRVLMWDWKAHGSDYVGHYAQAEINSYTARTLELDATALVRDWLALGNTGLHLSGKNKVSNIAGRLSATDSPVLIVDGRTCPCTASLQIHPSAANPITNTGVVKVEPACLMRFDLAGITSVTQATLKIRVLQVYSAGSFPLVYTINRLVMPEFTSDPVGDGFPVVPKDPLAQLIVADEFTNDASILAPNHLVTMPIAQAGVEYLNEGERKFVRCWGDQTNQRIVSWWKVFQPERAGSATVHRPWSRPYKFGESLGYDELWARWRIRIGSDVRDSFNEDGMKLPGFEGHYNLSGSGEYTLPAPTGVAYELRLWHTKPSDAYPHLYRGMIYYWAPDMKPEVPGYKEARWFNKHNVLWEADRWYEMAQGVRMNTLNADGSVNADGRLSVYVDGVLVHEDLNRMFRTHPSRQAHVFFMNVYHGGTKYPKGRLHYDLGEASYWTAYPGTTNQQENPDMATIETVIAKQTEALNEAYAVAGLPSVAEQLAAEQAKVANMMAAAQSAKAADAAADAADNASLDAIIAAGA